MPMGTAFRARQAWSSWFHVITPTEVAFFLSLGASIDISTTWIDSRGRHIYQDWKARINTQKMLWELNRKKKESPEAYQQTILSEVEALKKLKLSEREYVAEWEVNKYEREAAVLKSKVDEWLGDASASASAS